MHAEALSQQMSESLKRARKPFIWKNRFVGLGLMCFSIGIFAYSISAVQQDDFVSAPVAPPHAEHLHSFLPCRLGEIADASQSDVEDLLPPIDQRQSLKSIEDEERERGGPSHLRKIPGSVSSGSAMSPSPPGQSSWTSSDPRQGPYSYLWPRRLSDLDWVRKRGWVEAGTGNVLIWGAPPVDAVGMVGDGKTKGPRLV